MTGPDLYEEILVLKREPVVIIDKSLGGLEGEESNLRMGKM